MTWGKKTIVFSTGHTTANTRTGGKSASVGSYRIYGSQRDGICQRDRSERFFYSKRVVTGSPGDGRGAPNATKE